MLDRITVHGARQHNLRHLVRGREGRPEVKIAVQ
jgi:hypothetical protein